MATRRERLRVATIEDIKTAALAQIAEVGGPGLSLRGVARAIGMSPAGLYRYYDGRDALLTDLIADAYNDLADAVVAGIESGGTAPERFAGGIRAYRRWSIANRNRFLLIFGTPIPGYAAPTGGPTVAANRRMGEALFMVGVQGWKTGELHPPSLERKVTATEKQLASDIDPDLPPALIPVMLGTWAHFHGLVNLEVLHQLNWMYGDDAEALFESEIPRLLRAMGMDG